MRPRTWLAAFAVGLLAGSTSCGLELSEVASPIVGGTVDPGDPEVPRLFVVEGEGAYLCTGILISPRVVLTAAHCVDFGGAGPSTFTAEFGDSNDPRALGSRTVIAWTSDPQFDVMHPEAGHDIGLVALAERAPVSPKPYNRTAMESLAGQPARVVGFGLTLADREDGGIKREASVTIDAVDDRLFAFGGERGICMGDSGGPTFMTIDGVESVVGIHSFGDCNQAGAVAGYDGRVDRYVDGLIAPFIAAHDPACGADGVCDPRCETPDPDCSVDAEPGGCAAGGGRSGFALVLLGLAGLSRRRSSACDRPDTGPRPAQ
jgi:V8-like Glu-specific endopeptidase